MRLFVAIDPSEEQREELRLLQQRLSGSLDGVKWIRPAALHLTLKFLGEQEEDLLTVIIEAMQEAAPVVKPFTLQFGRIGVFPTPRRARIIWAGVTMGAGDLGTMAGSLEAALAKKGFPAEKRSFKAHLTLGRVRRLLPEKTLQGVLGVESSFTTKRAPVQSMRLYRSRLSSAGAHYTVLKEIFFYQDRGK